MLSKNVELIKTLLTFDGLFNELLFIQIAKEGLLSFNCVLFDK